jgi:glutathione S-transferase
MYQLHYFPSNANSAPQMVLEEIGQVYELVLIERAKNAQKSSEYLKINPNGRIPTLVDGGLALFEAAAIVSTNIPKPAWRRNLALRNGRNSING